jgi:hypothetical protein
LPVSAFFIPNTQKENMNDMNAQRVHLETFEDFDNGLSDLIDLWSSADTNVTATIKDAALANFKEDLEEATLQWVDNKAKSKKYTAIAEELAEFEDALNQG